jgi:HlyD family secretion protein
MAWTSARSSPDAWKVYVDYNDIVAVDAPLAKLDQSTFRSRVEVRASLAVAEAELLSVDAAVSGAQARFDEDERDYSRKAISRAKAASQTASNPRKGGPASEPERVADARGIEEVKARRSRRRLRPPGQIDLDRTDSGTISGVIIKRSIEPGQTVAVSLSAPELFTIANGLRNRSAQSTRRISAVRVAQTVSILLTTPR